MATKTVAIGKYELVFLDDKNADLRVAATGQLFKSWRDVESISVSSEGWIAVTTKVIQPGGDSPSPFQGRWYVLDRRMDFDIFNPLEERITEYKNQDFSVAAHRYGDSLVFEGIKIINDTNEKSAEYSIIRDPTDIIFQGYSRGTLIAENRSATETKFDLTSIFTDTDDVVDFNALKSAQLTLLKYGNRYESYDGNDTVKLPNAFEEHGSDTFAINGVVWNRAMEFRSGGGNDKVYGSNQADKVDLGEGDDTYIGSFGNDIVKGGGGNDTFDFQSATKAGGSRDLVRLDGGGQDFTTSKVGDVLKLKGSSSDYIIVADPLQGAGTPYHDQKILIQSASVFGQKTGQTPDIAFQVKNIEKVVFDEGSGPTNAIKLTAGSFVAEMAQLSKEVYGPLETLQHTAEYIQNESDIGADENAWKSKWIVNDAMKRGWHPVSALELGLPSSYKAGDADTPHNFVASSSLNFSIVAGHYQAWDSKDRFAASYVLPLADGKTPDVPESNALILTGVVNGKKTLTIAFRGTDQQADWDDYRNFKTHYEKYKPLLDALPQYIKDNGITQVFATGHSLGAGMVEYFMADDRFKAFNPRAVTFGSPGSEVNLPTNDTRILNFVHTDDLVGMVPDAHETIIPILLVAGLAGGPKGLSVATNLAKLIEDKDRHGVDVFINSAEFAKTGFDTGFSEHSMSLYVQDMVQLQKLAKAENGTSLYGTSSYGQFWKNEFAGYQAASGLQIGLSKPVGDQIGLSYTPLIYASKNDTFVLGGLPDNKILVRPSDEVPAKGFRIFDGGPGTDSIFLLGKQDDYFLQPDGTGQVALMKLMPHGTPDIEMGLVVSIEKFVFGDGTSLRYEDFLKKGIPVQGPHAALPGAAATGLGAAEPVEAAVIAALAAAADNPEDDPFAGLMQLIASLQTSYVDAPARALTHVFTAADLTGGRLVGNGGKDVLDLSHEDLSTFSLSADGGTVTVALNGRTTILEGIERVAFDKGVLAFDDDGMAGYAYRIYQAAFARTPDKPGLSYWFDVLDTGGGIKVVADSFLLSAEFQERYGTAPTNEQYIDLLYANVLNRKADKDGYDYWNDYLAKGGTRSEILIYFAESKENVANLEPELASGIWFNL